MRPLLIACLLLVSAGRSALTQDATPPASPFGDVPAGIDFAPLADASAADLVAIAAMIQVTRWTEKEGIGLVRACFDDETGGPLVFLVESGRFEFVVSEPGPGAAGLPSQGVPTLFRAADRRPVLVVPGTRIELSAGDVVLTPNGTECSLLSSLEGVVEPVVLVQVRFLPSGPFPLRNDAFTVIENFDVAVSLATANPPPPPAIIAGGLTLQPGAQLNLPRTVPAIALAIREGSLDVRVAGNAGILRRGEAGAPGPSEPIPPRTDLGADQGDIVYLPPAPNAVLRNPGRSPVSLLVVSVVPELWQPAVSAPAT